MNSPALMHGKFKFSARVEYVAEELDHDGQLFYMFNIKVTAEQVGSLSDPLQWSVIKSEDDFQQTHKVLKKKYGLLNNFQFRNPSAVGSNMFHLTHAVKPRRQKKDEYLEEILKLDPIPDEINAFLCLDNASLFTTNAGGTTVLEASTVVRAVDHSTAMTPLPSLTAPTIPVSTPTARPVPSVPVVATPVYTPTQRSKKQLWMNVGLVVSCLVMLSTAWFVSTIMSSVGKATGISNESSPVMIVYRVIGEHIHNQLIFLRARLEVVVVIAALLAYTHRVLGYALGWYLRSTLDPTRSGKFNFHFEWIALRLGLDHNMLVLYGVEWRNPPMFRNTPYLLRIDEISVVVDAMSVFRAIKGNSAIRVKEIRFNKVALYMEKLAGKVEISTEKTTSVETGGEGVPAGLSEGAAGSPHPYSPKSKLPSVRSDSTVSSSGAEVGNGGAVPMTASTTSTATATTLKPGVLNLWAAMGATNPQQEASMLTSISGQMNAAVDGTTSMVSVLGSAVAKYNPASMILKGGLSVGSTIGSTLGAGVGLLRTNSAWMVKGSTATAAAGASDLHSEEAAIKSAFEASLREHGHDSDGDGDGSDDEAEDEKAFLSHARASMGNNDAVRASTTDATAGRSMSDVGTAAAPAATTAPSLAAPAEAKKGFGFPYLLEIEALQLDRLELHTQDFLNAHHASDMSASVIKLKSLSMSHRDLTKPPKNAESCSSKGSSKVSDAEAEKRRRKRRPLYLDDVVWRLVNKLLAELLKNNSIAMMVLLSSAAANNTASVVSSAGSLAYHGAATGGKLLSSVGSVLVGMTSTGLPANATPGATTVPTPSPVMAPQRS